MPNFEVEIRRNYLDVSGLVLACPVSQVILSGSDVIGWNNIAPAVQPDSTDPRFLDLIQSISANQPTLETVGGQNYVRFDRTSSQYLNLLRNAGTWSGINEWTVAIVGNNGTDNSNSQDILSISNLEVRRRNASGNKSYIYNSTEQAGVGDFVDGASIILFKGSSGGDWYENGVLEFSGTCSDITPGDGRVGAFHSGGNYVDFDLNGIYIWKRILTTYEIDFLFNHIDPVLDHSVNDWATVSLQTWRDDTSSPPRINPYVGADHKYYHINVPTGTQRLLQIAAKIDGIVKPDSDLSSELFSGDWVEKPIGSVLPFIGQDTGYSSVFNIALESEGHYTFQIFRNNGGSIIVHFDVEET